MVMGAAVVGARSRFNRLAYLERVWMRHWCNAVNTPGADVRDARAKYQTYKSEADQAFTELREIEDANKTLAAHAEAEGGE